MNRTVRQGGVRLPLLLICVLAALVAWALAAAGPAAAAPSEPTMSLSDLQTAITAAGPGGLDGYFNTVLQGARSPPSPSRSWRWPTARTRRTARR